MIPVVLAAGATALCQGIGGALEKRGLRRIVARLDAPHVTWDLLRRRPLRVLAVAITTPIFILGVFLAMVVGGALLLFALSMGDGAKTGIFIGAITSAVYVAANVLIDRERLRPLHLVGIACAVAGGVMIALAGFHG